MIEFEEEDLELKDNVAYIILCLCYYTSLSLFEYTMIIDSGYRELHCYSSYGTLRVIQSDHMHDEPTSISGESC